MNVQRLVHSDCERIKWLFFRLVFPNTVVLNFTVSNQNMTLILTRYGLPSGSIFFAFHDYRGCSYNKCSLLYFCNNKLCPSRYFAIDRHRPMLIQSVRTLRLIVCCYSTCTKINGKCFKKLISQEKEILKQTFKISNEATTVCEFDRLRQTGTIF